MYTERNYAQIYETITPYRCLFGQLFLSMDIVHEDEELFRASSNKFPFLTLRCHACRDLILKDLAFRGLPFNVANICPSQT